MTSKSMRSFAAGLMVASGICGAVYFSGSSKAQTADKISEKEMKSALTSEGYVIHTKEEWNAQLSAVKEAEKKAAAAAAAADKKTAEKAAPKDTKEDTTEKVVYRTMLTVSEGMTSIDVGNALVQAHIIDNALEFSNAVEARGVANGLRLGMYEIQSGMTTDDIISTIFK